MQIYIPGLTFPCATVSTRRSTHTAWWRVVWRRRRRRWRGCTETHRCLQAGTWQVASDIGPSSCSNKYVRISWSL